MDLSSRDRGGEAPRSKPAQGKQPKPARERGGRAQGEWPCSKRQGHPSEPTEWELLQEGALDRLRHDLQSQAVVVGALKALVEKQMREQQDVATALQKHTRCIMREVCVWTRGYLEIRLKDLLGDLPAANALARGGERTPELTIDQQRRSPVNPQQTSPTNEQESSE